jgi:hypothetical protein
MGGFALGPDTVGLSATMEFTTLGNLTIFEAKTEVVFVGQIPIGTEQSAKSTLSAFVSSG